MVLFTPAVPPRPGGAVSGAAAVVVSSSEVVGEVAQPERATAPAINAQSKIVGVFISKESHSTGTDASQFTRRALCARENVGAR
jgi:hypothetical protein